MDYYLVVFSNRTETLDYASTLRNNKIPAEVVANPKGLGTTCGISVKIYERFIGPSLRIFRNKMYLTFVSFYKANYNGKGGYTFEKVSFCF